jgi:hypothetical protein
MRNLSRLAMIVILIIMLAVICTILPLNGVIGI